MGARQGVVPRTDAVALVGPPLGRRSKQWPLHVVLVLSGGLVVAGWLMIQGETTLAWCVALGAVACAVVVGVWGARAHARAELGDRLTEAVAGKLGWRAADRSIVVLDRWRGRGVGHPRRVRLRYGAGCDASDPAWRTGILDVMRLRLGTGYEVVKHDRRRCMIGLRDVGDATEGEDLSADQQRASQIVDELLGATATVQGWEHVGQTLAGFSVQHDVGTKLIAPGYRRRVESVVSAMLPGRWRTKWDLEADLVAFTLRPEIPRRVPHPAPVVTDKNLYSIPMGIDENATVVGWNLLSTPHQLITGRTGTGKTVVINTLVTECTYRLWPVWIIDPKRVEFMGLRGWPNVEVIATEIEKMVAVIMLAHEVMEDRYRQVDEDGAIETDFEPLIVVLDELSDFMGMLKAWWPTVKPKGAPAACPAIEKFYSLARKGRTSNIHLIVGMQRPDVALLGSGDARDNFTSRMSLGRLSPDGARMMWEASWPVATTIPTRIPGRGCAAHHDDPDLPVEVQGFWTPDPRRATRAGNEADMEIVEMLRPPSNSHPLKAVVFPDELMRPSDGEPAHVWEAVVGASLQPSLEGMVGLCDQAPAPATVLDYEPDVVTDVCDADDPEAYAVPDEVAACQIEVGDLMLVDEASDLWATVESIEVDPVDEFQLVINWVDESGTVEGLECSDDLVVSIRRPAFDDSE